jgi:hypothetical protein
MTDIASLGAGGAGFGGGRPPSQPLSNDQKTLVEETLSAYDADSLTEDDAQAIVQAFKDAGIRPGKELEGLASDLGFDLREVGELAGLEKPDGPPPSPPPGGDSLNTQDLSTLQSIIDNYDLNDLSEEEEEEIITQLEDAELINEQGSLLSLTV